jgi:5-(aminomethyl)-3-furanmethanol phosphate kinase
MSRPIVIKVGGSLFDWPELPRRLNAVLDKRRTAHQHLILLAGGGRAADFIRALDHTFALGDVAAHRLALRSLDLTAHVLAALVPDLDMIDDLAQREFVWNRKRMPVFAPRRFLEEHDPEPLPCCWELTSDSIAARLAVHLEAAELVLLKSAPLPPGTDRRAAAGLGLVDPLFPEVSRGLRRVLYLNLRGNRPEPLLLPQRQH